MVPALWFGALGAFIAIPLSAVLQGKGAIQNIIPIMVMPLLMAVVGIFVFRKTVWDLADEVSDGGDFLLVRRSGIEQRIPLSDIINVGMSQSSNTYRLSLRLRKPCKFGDEVVFAPRRKFFPIPFSRNEVAEDLIRRCDAARRNAA